MLKNTLNFVTQLKSIWFDIKKKHILNDDLLKIYVKFEYIIDDAIFKEWPLLGNNIKENELVSTNANVDEIEIMGQKLNEMQEDKRLKD